MAPRRVKKVNKFDSKKLSANDVICPMCRSILIKPITLPCSHGFCSSCFEAARLAANVVCPICRVRVGSWIRSATKSKKLINESLWQRIQNLFPLQVRNKLNGLSENIGDKYQVKEINDNRTGSIKSNEKSTLDLEHNNLQKRNIKKTEQSSAVPSTSEGLLTKNSAFANAVPKSRDQTLSVNSEKNAKFAKFFLNNFATKEYTCRILCQNVSSKETQKNTFKESQVPIQKKNKRIKEITESEVLNDRSNSIESECLYFKPIDYRHNPPSEGLAPIKVPTKKPNINPNIKILAPSGQNQINMNHLESAFARLCSAVTSDEKETSKREQEDTFVASTKRKCDKSENKARKKIKTNNKSVENQSKESTNVEVTKVCNTNRCKDSILSLNDTSNTKKSMKQSLKNMSEDYIKRKLQEQADFELATKLQQAYNQSATYATRSAVLKQMATTSQVKMEGMTPYKVK